MLDVNVVSIRIGITVVGIARRSGGTIQLSYLGRERRLELPGGVYLVQGTAGGVVYQSGSERGVTSEREGVDGHVWGWGEKERKGKGERGGYMRPRGVDIEC